MPTLKGENARGADDAIAEYQEHLARVNQRVEEARFPALAAQNGPILCASLFLRTGPIEGYVLAGPSRPVPLKPMRIDQIVSRFAPGSDLTWSSL